MVIILLGAPGSGKGTQGKFLAEKLHLPHVSIGEIFRKMVKEGGKEGQLINKYLEAGQLVPSDFVNSIMKNLLSTELKNGCILDGYPRNLEQAKFLNEIINQLIKVVVFDINDETAINRILNRFNCKDCGIIYSNLSLNKDICKGCGGSNFITRKDDNRDIIINRIKVYKEETYPVIDFFNGNKEIYRIDSTKNIEEITKILVDQLKSI